MTAPPLTRCCPACRHTSLRRVEMVSVAALGHAWGMDRAAAERPDGPIDAGRQKVLAGEWTRRIEQAVGSREIAFDRCERCGLQVSSPCRAWPPGSYPADEHYPARWEFGRFLDDLGSQPLRVLELGAGRGSFVAQAAARGHRTLGVDFSETAVAFAREQGRPVLRGGFDQLRTHLAGTQETRFDAVALFHVIEHLPDPLALLRALREFVRPGTLLGVSCPGPGRFTRRIRVQQVGSGDFWDYPPHHVLRWSPPAMTAALNEAGWDVQACVEEPFALVAAASQLGVTDAYWKGFHHRPLRRRIAIGWALLRLVPGALMGRHRGLSLYTLAQFRG